ncbi:MAG: dihydroorotase [Actinomycetes bacterium]|nr:dihydroorotase [Actinomycetes bacterium]
MVTLIRGARLVDPQLNLDAIGDVLIAADGLIEEVDIVEDGGSRISAPDGACVIDGTGKILIPGPIDLHVHLREPGQEYKETILTGTRAAAHGGWVGVCAIPNTEPVADEGATIRNVLDRAAETAYVPVYPYGAITRGQAGKQLAEISDMLDAGAVGFTDDGHGVQNPLMMRRAMEYAKVFDALILAHAEDEQLADGGVVNEGRVATRLGLPGQTGLAESLQVIRDIELARLTGARLHICHVSTKESVAAIRAAKAAGVRVTAEATPHHLVLNENALSYDYDTRLKMAPPLRSEADRKALVAGLVDGTIDAIATDHAPHAKQEKELEFELAKFGTTGLETAIPVLLTDLVATGQVDLPCLVERLSAGPRRVLGLESVLLQPGCVADLTLIDPEATVTVTEDWLVGKSKNSAFIGRELRGAATDVFVEGVRVMADGVVCD